jgi:hypothetical protein
MLNDINASYFFMLIEIFNHVEILKDFLWSVSLNIGVGYCSELGQGPIHVAQALQV